MLAAASSRTWQLGGYPRTGSLGQDGGPAEPDSRVFHWNAQRRADKASTPMALY